jgi:hypothetical protein
MNKFRKELSAQGLISIVNQTFSEITDHRDHGIIEVSLRSALMSAEAM